MSPVEQRRGDGEAAPTGPPSAVDPTPRRWIVAAAALLTLAAVLQRFGEIVYLTRLDRVLDPWRMAARNFELWNPYWDFGALQFQTIGYLVPFDLFFLVGTVTSLPTWLVERLFIAALLVVGLWGFVRLADEFDLGRPPFRVAAGLAYVTSPIVLTRVGWQSVFAMGVVFLPWALIPLVRGSRGGSPRRAAMRSGVAIALMGGANASVTLAVLPVPLLYLLTRERGPRRAGLVRWWLLAVPLATLWWGVGLYFYARYGPDVLEYTEQVEDTVALTAIFEVLRGTADWVLRLGATPPAGAYLAQRSAAILTTAFIAAVGLAGLARRRVPERTFLVLCLLLGVAAVGGGAGGVLGNPMTEQYVSLLAGPLEAFRNVYKFQPLILLPASLGLAHALTGVVDRARSAAPAGVPSRARHLPVVLPVVAAVVALLVAGAYPLWRNMVTRGPGFDDIPTAWDDATEFLAANAHGRVLIVPGIPDGDFDWGFTAQLPLQWGADIAWATRSQAPLSGLESVEYLDAVERAIERGGDQRLGDFLRRGGVSHVVLPSDQRSTLYGAPAPEAVDAALSASGLERVAGFGRGGYGFGDIRQIEVFAVADGGPVTVHLADQATWLSGDIESTLNVPSELFGDRPFLLVEDGPAPSELEVTDWIVTDGNQATTTNFGFNRNNRSYVHGAGEPPFDGASSVEHLTFQTLPGLESVTASSVGPGIFVRDSPALQPWHVVDGDRDTVWQPFRYDISGDGIWGAGDPWVEIEYSEPTTMGSAALALAPGPFGGDTVLTVTAETDGGTTTTELRPTESWQRLPVVGGPTSRLKVSIDLEDLLRFGDVVGIAELRTPGTPVGRRLAVPSELDEQVRSGELADPAWVFTRNRPAVNPLVGFDSESQLRRRFEVPRPATFTLLGSAIAERGPQLLRHLATTPELSVWTDSTWFGRPEVGPRNLIDGERSTVWRSAATTDDAASTRATVELDWSDDREVSRIRLGTSDVFASPSEVVVRAGDRLRRADVGRDGWVEFRPLTTDELDITLVYPARDGGDDPRLIGLNEIEVPALSDLGPGPLVLDEPYRVRCDAGLAVTVDGHTIALAAETTVGALVSGARIDVAPCGADEVDLGAGPVVLEATSGESLLTVDQIVLGNEPVLDASTGPARSSDVTTWEPTRRTVALGGGDQAIVVVNEIFNAGWEATFDGRVVPAVRIDGWRQGFVVTNSASGVLELRYTPDAAFRFGTVFALLALGLLAVLAVWRPRAPHTGPIGPARLPRWAATVVVVLGSVWCVGAAAILLVPLWWLRMRRRHVLPWIVACGLSAAAVVVVAAGRLLDWSPDDWGPSSVVVGALAAISLLGVLVTLLPEPRSGTSVSSWRQRSASGRTSPAARRR